MLGVQGDTYNKGNEGDPKVCVQTCRLDAELILVHSEKCYVIEPYH
jgi:hypothetical protein